MTRKRIFPLFLIATLPLLLSCGAIEPLGTSLVTITIGGGATASLSARPVTTWERIERFFADAFDARPAAAQTATVPANVAQVRVTATASDMATLSTTVSVTVTANVTVSLEVPNGLNRQFLVEGLNASGSVTYSGQATADLTGVPVNLTVTLAAVPIVNPADTTAPAFAGIHLAAINTISSTTLDWVAATDNVSAPGTIVYLIYQSTTSGGQVFTAPTYTAPAGSTTYGVTGLTPGTIYYFVVRARDEAGNIDTNTVEMSFVYPGKYVSAATGTTAAGCGSQANPCRTIQSAMTPTFNNQGMFVSAGTYTISAPQTINAGVQLACIGAGHSTVIVNAVTGGAMLSGSQGVLIDGCKITDPNSSSSPIITDNATDITVNNVVIQGNGIFSTTGIALSRKSVVSNVTVTGFVFNASPGNGVLVSSGATALITNSTFSGNFNGVVVSGGSVTISSTTIIGNTIGITVSGATTTAVIAGNTIRNNSSTGISFPVGAGAPTASVSGNSIDHNGTGIGIQAGSLSIHNNNIFCNSSMDLNYGLGTPLDVTNNSWDHSPPTTQIPTCPSGMDICLGGGAVTFTPFSATATGACPP